LSCVAVWFHGGFILPDDNDKMQDRDKWLQLLQTESRNDKQAFGERVHHNGAMLGVSLPPNPYQSFFRRWSGPCMVCCDRFVTVHRFEQ
jgi:hypothetical protein